jgi:hypothetical protein
MKTQRNTLNIFACLFVFLFCGKKALGYEFNWNMFMTTAATQTDKPLLSDDGSSKEFDVSRYSKYAISASTVLNENWESIVNLVFRQTKLGNDNPVDLALLAYKDPNDVSVFRVGRQRVPTWLISDHLNVGILYPWVRPPEEVYLLNPIHSLNTASYSHNLHVGNGELQTEIYLGGGESEILIDGNKEARTTRDIKLLGGVVAFENDDLLLRASYNKVNAGFKVLARQVVTLAPGVEPELDFPVDFDLGDLEFWSVGLKKELGNFWLWAEYASEMAEHVLNVRRSGYVMLGYDCTEKFKVHLTRSQLFENEFDASGVFGGAIGKQYSMNVGMNYFFTDNVVFKLETTTTYFTDNGYAMSTNLNNTGAVPGVGGEPDHVQTYAVSVDASF